MTSQPGALGIPSSPRYMTSEMRLRGEPLPGTLEADRRTLQQGRKVGIRSGGGSSDPGYQVRDSRTPRTAQSPPTPLSSEFCLTIETEML